jgi:hypothetical protein
VGLSGPLGACDRGPSTARSSGGGTARAAIGPAGDPNCPVGRWKVTAQEEFAQVGLGDLTGGSVQATGGTVLVVFGADHTYTFSYQQVRLSLGDGSGSATVNGPVQGTWRLAGEVLTSTVSSSRIGVSVTAAGVTVIPSQSLNTALQKGLPGSARVHCSGGRLVTTITAGVAAGRKVTFAAG